MATTLTDTRIAALKTKGSERLEVADEGPGKVAGLRVRVTPTGKKSFVVRKRVGAKVHNLMVGSYGPRFGLAEARRKARTLLNDLESGKAVPKAAKRTGAGALTVRALYPDYLAAKGKLRSLPAIKRLFEKHLLPELGDRMADCVTRAEITALTDPIARENGPVQARAVHAHLSSFYTWAMPRLDKLTTNPCRDAGKPPVPTPRDRVLSEAELAALWHVADALPSPWGPAVKLLMLTGARRLEVFDADRAEFDLEAREWIIPPERAKNGAAHILPLSDAALAVLEAIPAIAGSKKLFPAEGNPERGASGFDNGLRRLVAGVNAKLEREAGERWTLHDIRRSVATGLQRLGIRFEVTEAVLNHLSGARGGVAGIYQRHDWKAEKRAALEAWARELERIAAGAKRTANVVDLHAA